MFLILVGPEQNTALLSFIPSTLTNPFLSICLQLTFMFVYFIHKYVLMKWSYFLSHTEIKWCYFIFSEHFADYLERKKTNYILSNIIKMSNFWARKHMARMNRKLTSILNWLIVISSMHTTRFRIFFPEGGGGHWHVDIWVSTGGVVPEKVAAVTLLSKTPKLVEKGGADGISPLSSSWPAVGQGSVLDSIAWGIRWAVATYDT